VGFALLGCLLIGFGIFGAPFACARPGVPCSGPSVAAATLSIGLASSAVGLLLLLRVGWAGTRRAWLLAAPVAATLTWTGYELIRQGPAPGIGLLGEMTAPALVAAVVASILLVAWFRLAGGTRDIPRR
jgi:hypothetical protein